MTKKFEVTMERTALVVRSWVVEARSPEEAQGIVNAAIDLELNGHTIGTTTEDEWLVLTFNDEHKPFVQCAEVNGGETDLAAADVLSAFVELGVR